ncbi:exo-beta-N-acetylmuramidase NamZ domain-containing protein [candidate division KSB1 bacterium]
MKKNIFVFTMFFSLFLLLMCGQKQTRVMVGIEVLIEEQRHLLKNKRVGIITNQTGITSSGEHIVDVLSRLPDVEVTAIFAPEHGFRGNKPDALQFASYVDERTGVKVWSLYGRALKPTPEMLESVDVLAYDIQDVGARFYTFISTMGLGMEAAAENGKSFIVLDRPNPITGTILEGPVMEEKYYSFVGKYPIPVRYGMTPGELAQMIKGEGWMNGVDGLDLTVVPLKGWKRDMWYDETGLPWVKPSPNIPTIITAELYPGMCLFEAVSMSEARGTMRPFEQFGAPWIDSDKLAELMNEYALPGIFFRSVSYIPVPIPDAVSRPRFQDEEIKGLEFIVTDRTKLRPLDAMVYLFNTVKQHYPDEMQFRSNLERLIGIQSFRSDMNNARHPQSILNEWTNGLSEFDNLRQKYLLYK